MRRLIFKVVVFYHESNMTGGSFLCCLRGKYLIEFIKILGVVVLTCWVGQCGECKI